MIGVAVARFLSPIPRGGVDARQDLPTPIDPLADAPDMALSTASSHAALRRRGSDGDRRRGTGRRPWAARDAVTIVEQT